LPLILALASRLRDSAPVDAQGVALLGQLLSDGAGRCYTCIHPEALTVALEEVSHCLDVAD
jgi:hypothetical protein